MRDCLPEGHRLQVQGHERWAHGRAESKLQQQVDRLLAEAERIDAQKDAQYGMSSHTRKRGFLTDGARKRAGRRTPGEDHLAAEKIEGHGASTLLALG